MHCTTLYNIHVLFVKFNSMSNVVKGLSILVSFLKTYLCVFDIHSIDSKYYTFAKVMHIKIDST